MKLDVTERAEELEHFVKVRLEVVKPVPGTTRHS